MEIKQEFVLALVAQKTNEIVEELFRRHANTENSDKMSVEYYDITFRLYKSSHEYVLFQYLTISGSRSYFQPIGFYDRSGSIFLLNDFYPAYEELVAKGKSSVEVNFLSLRINGVVAAFSIPVIQTVENIFQEFEAKGMRPQLINGVAVSGGAQYNRKLLINNLNCELNFEIEGLMEGYPEFYLNSEYNLPGPICRYVKNDRGNIIMQPEQEYEREYNLLDSLKLLTALNPD